MPAWDDIAIEERIVKTNDLPTDLDCRDGVSQFVKEDADRNENEECKLSREATVDRGQFIVGEGAPIFDRGPNCADAQKCVEEREEVKELHR